MNTEVRKSLVEIIRFAVTILVIVVPIRAFIAQPFIVSGDSMFPTFEDKEYLIIDEVSYYFTEPERGEVIVFRYPEDPSKYFIKRIIALPGEKIEITGQKVEITSASGEKMELDEPYAAFTNGLGSANIEIYLDEDEYFVMGDNRDWSLDSRAWGPVREKLIRGKVFVRLFPIDRADYLPGQNIN